MSGFLQPGSTVRPRYERESSTSDSVFSPQRRKSSASSRSLDEENLFTSTEYQEIKKSNSESDTCFRDWGNQPGTPAGESGEKPMKYLPVKSPVCDESNSLRVLTLSSPSEFQYRKHTKLVSRLSASSADQTSVSSSEKVSVSPGRISNSSSSSENLENINAVQSQKSNSCQRSPVDFYKARGSGTSVFPMPTTPTISVEEANVIASSPNIYKTPYEPTERKSPYVTSETKFRYGTIETEQQFTNPYGIVDVKERKGSLTYEGYNFPQAAESKLLKEGYNYKTHPQDSVERRHSDTDTVPVFKIESNNDDLSHIKESEKGNDRHEDRDMNVGKDKANYSPDYRAYSFGLFSPLHRSLFYGGRGMGRERSQSLSEVVNLSKEEHGSVPHRARFPSSSFVENLDTPLIIDDDVKVEAESYEGLDLSKKRRKMSETYQLEEDQTETLPTSDNSNLDDKESQEKLAYPPGSAMDSSVKKYGKGNFIKVSTGYQCRICCRVIRHMNNTTAHMRIHANLKPYKCQVCNQQFKYEVDRRYHFSKQHVDLFAKMYFPDGEKKPE